MTKVVVPESRAAILVGIETTSTKVSVLALGWPAEIGEEILFLEGRPTAIKTGGFVYIAPYERKPSTTNLINRWAGDRLPQVAMPTREFDFMIGQAFTRWGLNLVRGEDPRKSEPPTQED